MKTVLHRVRDSTLQHFNVLPFCRTLVLGVPLFALVAHGQPFLQDKTMARSISGQFIVHGSSQFSILAVSPEIATDTNFVRLEPALLAVSAERIKDLLWHRLEIKLNTPWRGQIYLVIHPAQSLDESVTIVSRQTINGWDYRVELPDVLSRTRFTRALTGGLLLELANRDARSRSAEIPAWLTDGFAQQLLAAGSPEFILSSPATIVNGMPEARINATQRGLDSLAAAQAVLKKNPPLTFEQLSWPDAAQLDGGDGGAYRASAQVFVSSLLALKNGPQRMCAMLESLPNYYNWQFAFQSAFRTDFPRTLEVEKWWALQTAGFAVRDPGSLWTPAASQVRLAELLSVPVEMRAASNSLPAPAEISLQTAIRSLDFNWQTTIFQDKLRDLGLARLRMAPQFAALAEAYRHALASYLGELPTATPASNRHGRSSSAPSMAVAGRALKKLDELDARRRAIESNAGLQTSLLSGLAR